jgi:2-aminoadipate transaminase
MHCSRAHRRRIRVEKRATDKSRVRLCFDNPSHETIHSGVAALAEVCRREFGVPSRIANVERARA